ncbi:uncharacterized protein LOC115631209 [Scaptodrosophila lebanonensis]|uniref:Uncharacterized protein LOC115631209 n=1 Tax=Drosophila lebanonensis TaxID=7225 RepID=A0A6J2U616_DROLE|nr:uncharacterized protein LOC115631209 [Scaptodrosophila lebanonensis]
MSEPHRLISIGLDELQAFQELYKRDWPTYCAEFYCLDNFIRFLVAEPEIKNLKAYSLAEHRSDGLFIFVDRYQLFVGSLNSTNGGVARVLQLLDWSMGFKCSSIPTRHYDALSRVVREKCLEVEYDDITKLYFMPAARALQMELNVPSGFVLRSLRVKDAALINADWPNRHEGSLYFVKRQIKMCVNVGLYEESTQRLVAWCLRLQGGYLGALQVRNTHKRRGFGSLVATAMALRIAGLKQDVMALVNPENNPSCSMFDKLGFQVIDHCHWLRTLPVAGNFSWPDGE